jgi:hypothetical protein
MTFKGLNDVVSQKNGIFKVLHSSNGPFLFVLSPAVKNVKVRIYNTIILPVVYMGVNHGL